MSLPIIESSLIKIQSIERVVNEEVGVPIVYPDTSNFILIYVLKGAGRIASDSKDYDIKKGSIILINAHTHSTIALLRKTEWIQIVIDGIVITDVNQAFVNHQIIVKEAHNDFVKSYLDLMLFEEAHSFQASKYIQKRLFITLLYRILIENELSYKATSSNTRSEEIDAVITYLTENYQEPITLDSLSEIFGLSKYYLIKLFRQTTAYTPIEYLIQIRISQAEKLLKETNLTISEVCLEVGFKTQSYFSKVFKNITGLRPMEFRKKYSQVR